MSTVKPLEKTTEVRKPEVYHASKTKVFDLINTTLQIRFDWAKRYLHGKAVITATPHFYPQKELILDARGMLINALELKKGQDTRKADYIYRNDSLIITLDRAYAKDEEVVVVIDYVARPEELEAGGSAAITSDKGLYFINPDGKEIYKQQQIWTQGETQAASAWFPTIDAPDQKMTQQIAVTTDTSMITLSNGIMISSVKNNDGTRTDTWKQQLPHAPYLAMVVVGKFSVIKDTWRGKEVSYYVEKKYEESSKKVFAETPAMIEFFSSKFGVDYPWEKYAQIVVRDYVSGSMENTSATLHGEFMLMDERNMLDFDGEDYISHELCHQWFGNLVTCESWSNLSLNESFATYGEYLWTEFRHGREKADYALRLDHAKYLREAKLRRVNLVRFDYESQEDMFDRHSYEKGASILHMLRKYVGDDAFFASLNLYLRTYQFKTAEVHNLRLAFEEITGEDLNWFFNQWFYDKGHPSLDISYSWNEATSEVSVRVRQEQDFRNTPLYKLPVSVDIYSGSSVERMKMLITKADETFIYKVPSKPDLVNFDGEKMLIGVKEDHHTDEEWMFMYQHGKLCNDKLEAIIALLENYPVPSKKADILKSALDDKFDAVRNYAVSKTETLSGSVDSVYIKNKLINMMQHDPSSDVRARALHALVTYFKGPGLSAVIEPVLYDSSYSVAEEALRIYSSYEPEKGLAVARKMENVENPSVNDILMDVFARYGEEEDAEYMHAVVTREYGYERYESLPLYSKFLQNLTDQNAIRKGCEYIYNVALEDETWWVRIAAVQALQGVHTYAKNNQLISAATYIEKWMTEIRNREKDQRVSKLFE